ncbi:hypothetical protein GCM10027570_14700 [Streptomonospora sediminis]
MGSEEKVPVYPPSEISEIVLDFLTFLTTLYRDPGELVVPPPGGWPGYSPEKCDGFKSDLVIEVLRNLPYLVDRTSDQSDCLGQINYKSHLLDYRTVDSVRSTDHEHLWPWEDESEDEESWDEESAPDHVFVFAEGFESGGVTLFIDVREGRAVEERIRCDGSGYDIKEYFEGVKEKYRNLGLIPCPGWGMLVDDSVGAGKPGEVLSEEEVLMQTAPIWGTDLDLQYTRQLYRAFGWPDNFRRDEAFREIKELIEKRVA